MSNAGTRASCVGFWNAMGVPTKTVRRCHGEGGVRHNGPQFCVNSMMMVDHHMIYSWEMIEASLTHTQKWGRKNLGLLRGGFLSSHDQIIKFLPNKVGTKDLALEKFTSDPHIFERKNHLLIDTASSLITELVMEFSFNF